MYLQKSSLFMLMSYIKIYRYIFAREILRYFN